MGWLDQKRVVASAGDVFIEPQFRDSTPHSSAIRAFSASNSSWDVDGNLPSSNPSRLLVLTGTAIGTRRAAGLPFRAMMISDSAPLSTRSTRRDRFDLASSMSTVVMGAP